MAKGIRPGQIPDWRPGAEFWKPLADGREVTVYRLLGGKGRLCVGPLAGNRYDIAYRYAYVEVAITAARDWDPEKSPTPPGYELAEHPGRAVADMAFIPPVTDRDGNRWQQVKSGDRVVTVSSPGTGVRPHVEVERPVPGGRQIFQGWRFEDVNGTTWIEVTDMRFEKAERWGR